MYVCIYTVYIYIYGYRLLMSETIPHSGCLIYFSHTCNYRSNSSQAPLKKKTFHPFSWVSLRSLGSVQQPPDPCLSNLLCCMFCCHSQDLHRSAGLRLTFLGKTTRGNGTPKIQRTYKMRLLFFGCRWLLHHQGISMGILENRDRCSKNDLYDLRCKMKLQGLKIWWWIFFRARVLF